MAFNYDDVVGVAERGVGDEVIVHHRSLLGAYINVRGRRLARSIKPRQIRTDRVGSADDRNSGGTAEARRERDAVGVTLCVVKDDCGGAGAGRVGNLQVVSA